MNSQTNNIKPKIKLTIPRFVGITVPLHKIYIVDIIISTIINNFTFLLLILYAKKLINKAVIDKINQLAAQAKEHGEQVGIIATDETKDRYPEGLVVSIGSRKEEETIAHHLYEVLRDFDQSAVRSIYSEAFYTPRMGQAIMNRLLKAAGHKIIQVV